uniref:Uncharacterized protein n=1 Tax=Anguilla anguilla TaxID=7936 RepID=A0A0E9VZJ4_ANGAN
MLFCKHNEKVEVAVSATGLICMIQ